MNDIEFSVMEGNPGDAQHLLPLLDAFEKQYRIHVNLIGIPWGRGWTEIAKYGIYGSGPDVSSIGSTWIGSLASMQALRPFGAQEVKALGGADAFFEAGWKSVFLPNDSSPWAIPWLADTLVIYFWKDALEKAGVKDFEMALASDAGLFDTLKKLQADGIKHPLAMTTTANSPVIIQEAAHWIWNAGGDFLSPDFRKVLFTEPAAMSGWRSYFSLAPFISPASLKAASSGELFNQRASGDAVVTFAGPWKGVTGRMQHPEWDQTLGIVPVPGTAFVGGSSLVIWQYSRKSREAFELVRFLSSQPTRIPAAPHEHGLPTRRDALNMPSVEYDPFHRIYLQALQSGRSFPSVRLWGSVEDKLIAQITAIWEKLLADPALDLDACLHEHLNPLAKHLNIVLGN
jgi:multiple sugar transport system substrate-binding protein